MKIYHSLLAASLFMALPFAMGCEGTGNVVADGKAVTGVEISPDKTVLAKGDKLQFEAKVLYADGTSKDVTSDPSTVWNTSDPTIASVSKSGMVTAVEVGGVDISAEYKGEKGNEHFAIGP